MEYAKCGRYRRVYEPDRYRNAYISTEIYLYKKDKTVLDTNIYVALVAATLARNFF
jgi:hypothetical protein